MALPFLTDPAQIAEAVLLYTEHEWTLADIAEHFEVGNTTVKRRLVEAGVTLRPAHTLDDTALKIKQCSHCLHFLPVGLFSFRDPSKRRRASWCMDCTLACANNTDTQWNPDPQPLAAAINTWRPQ